MHMPGQSDTERVPKMSVWLGKIKSEQKWAVEVEKTALGKEIEGFWKREGEKGKGEERKTGKSKAKEV